MDRQKKKVGNYLLVSQIGKGQFGVVYKGVQIDDQRKVYAIKCIQKAKLEKNSILSRLFQTEMAVMSKINHPNVMHLYEFMETQNNYYLVIQYCNNGDLESYMKKMGRLSEQGNSVFQEYKRIKLRKINSNWRSNPNFTKGSFNI